MDYSQNNKIEEGKLVRFFTVSDHLRTNPFGGSTSGLRVYRRTERLVAAVHLLTAHIAADEPVRTRARTASLDLLAAAMDLRVEMRSPSSPQVGVFYAHIRSLVSLVRLLAVSGSVSIQNADVITEALDELGTFLAVSQRSHLSEDIRLTPADFMDAPVVPPVSNRTIVKDTTIQKDATKPQNNVQYKKTQEKTGGAGRRAATILDILRTGGELGIREITAYMPEYSEKMVQRELLDMVHEGIVKKTGNKRWSKYSAA